MAKGRPGSGYFRRRIVIFILIAVMLAMGMVYGAIGAGSLDSAQKGELLSWVEKFFQDISRTEKATFAEVVRRALWDDVLKTAGFMWLAGLSIIGSPLILGLAFLRGFVLGFAAGFMVKTMTLKGVVLVITSVVPHNLFVVPAVLLAGGASVSFSLAALKTLLGRTSKGVYYHFLTTTFFCILAGILLVVGTIVEYYITPVLVELVRNYVL